LQSIASLFFTALNLDDSVTGIACYCCEFWR